MDHRQKDIDTALKLLRGMTTYDDALEFLVCSGFTIEEATKALSCSCKTDDVKQTSFDF
jgi:hypothetical protein